MKRTLPYLYMITLLPLLFFTSKYAWLIKYFTHLIIVCIYSFNFLYLDIYDSYELFENFKESIERLPNILFSEGQARDENFAKEFSKSFNRIKDFINISKEDGSGSYPEDFSYQGYRRDNNSVTHSKVPSDWGINELYNFGEYSDMSKRQESAGQIAVWLEYDHRVNQRRFVDLISNDPTFNSSGKKWFKDFCKDQVLYGENMPNTYELRKSLRDIAAGRKT